MKQQLLQHQKNENFQIGVLFENISNQYFKKKPIFTFILCMIGLLLFSSCQPLIWIYGSASGNLKNPKVENSASVMNFVKKYNVNYDALYIIKDNKSIDLLSKYNNKIPMIILLDSNKWLLNSDTFKGCTKDMIHDILDKDTLSVVQNDSSRYNFLMNLVDPIDVKYRYEKYDYYWIVGWVKFTPKIAEYIFETANEMYNNTGGKKVCVILINRDYREKLKK